VSENATDNTDTVDGIAQTDVGSDSQVRGSSLLLVGRILSMAINYATQILIIRYLAKSDYGAFAYALSLVAVIQATIQLGLDRGLSRYIPIYDERRDEGALVGSIGFASLVAIGMGLVVAAAYWLGRSFVAGTLISDPVAVSVLAVLVVLAPVEALDNLLITSLAALNKTMSIFLRSYVVAPLLKLCVVVILLLTGQGVVFLAIGYTAAAMIGFTIFAFGLARLLRERRDSTTRWTMRFPMRELLTFSLPLLTTDLVFIVMNGSDVVMLEWFGNTSDVAALKAVQPTAKLSQTILTSFGILYVPYIARMYARSRFSDVGDRYWQSVNWVAVLSTPIVCAALLFSRELTGDLLGAEYSDSAVILAVLTVGYFTNAIFGYNGMTLNVYRKVRFLVVLNVIAMASNIILNLALIPRIGPLGAAIGTAGTLLIHNIAKQLGVRRLEGMSRTPRVTWRAYGVIALLLGLSAGVGFTSSAGFQLRLAIGVLIGMATIGLSRSVLRIEDAFPELKRIAFLRRLLG
jgi:O-antigen/teichoic acid export membrane protein